MNAKSSNEKNLIRTYGLCHFNQLVCNIVKENISVRQLEDLLRRKKNTKIQLKNLNPKMQIS